MLNTNRRKIPHGSRIHPEHSSLSQEEIDRRNIESKNFADRCRLIFQQVYPQLVDQHKDWFIYIEPDSGDYVIDPEEEICFQKIRQKHPHAKIMAMRLNETGTCGRI
ncbi:hypothetical protein [Gloeothece verrucosa]|uniref:Uncharacterized protein n=1 Tax=Gloeothece verrucosa (strain PCC 7822) TaxID=497965 RepID=E0UGY0_GLOV7|nr:hypothetical protein [Gloeothece verrucosa]ADN14461.1 conserved hypothetical protein [Gloeothece verrucosa PCC 7822]